MQKLYCLNIKSSKEGRREKEGQQDAVVTQSWGYPDEEKHFKILNIIYSCLLKHHRTNISKLKHLLSEVILCI